MINCRYQIYLTRSKEGRIMKYLFGIGLSFAIILLKKKEITDRL